jgi:hypothetical protein
MHQLHVAMTQITDAKKIKSSCNLVHLGSTPDLPLDFFCFSACSPEIPLASLQYDVYTVIDCLGMFLAVDAIKTWNFLLWWVTRWRRFDVYFVCGGAG